MKIRLFPLLVTGALIAAVVTPSLEAGAEPVVPVVPVGPVTIPAANLSYLEREKLAAPPIRARLATLRAELAASKLPYTVGYTTAMDRSLSELTGLVVPKDAAAQAAAHAPIQAQLLKIDETNRQEFIKRNPKRFERVDPRFNLSSARGDWRALGKVSPIRDQGGCGSCWAFAAVGAFESAYAIRNNVNPDTSEQAVLSCSGGGNCPHGGWTSTALSWLTSHGTDKEVEYPYTAMTGTCHAFGVDYKASAWGYINPDGIVATTTAMKSAIVKYGPIVVALYASPKFQAYTGGVFYEAVPAGAANHAVVLVGWDDDQVGPNGVKGAWILRNSWGTGWGSFCDLGIVTDRGYMYLAYGSSNVGYWSQWIQAPFVGP